MDTFAKLRVNLGEELRGKREQREQGSIERQRNEQQDVFRFPRVHEPSFRFRVIPFYQSRTVDVSRRPEEPEGSLFCCPGTFAPRPA